MVSHQVKSIWNKRCTTESPCVAPVKRAQIASRLNGAESAEAFSRDVLGPTHSMLSGYLPPLRLRELHLTISRRDLEDREEER